MATSFPDLWRRLLKVPFITTFAVVMVLQVMGEQFPFSPFPMYSGFSDETTVLYVTDGQNKPLAIKVYFRLSASKVKKSFGTELKEICKAKGYSESEATPEDLREAGQKTLLFLKTQTRPGAQEKIAAHGMNLHRITLKMDKQGFHEETAIIGELAR